MMKENPSVKHAHFIKWINYTDLFVIVINILAQMVLNGVGLERIIMYADVDAIYLENGKMFEANVL